MPADISLLPGRVKNVRKNLFPKSEQSTNGNRIIASIFDEPPSLKFRLLADKIRTEWTTERTVFNRLRSHFTVHIGDNR